MLRILKIDRFYSSRLHTLFVQMNRKVDTLPPELRAVFIVIHCPLLSAAGEWV